MVLQKKEHTDVLLEVIDGFHETKVISGANLVFKFITNSRNVFTGFHALITSIEGKTHLYDKLSIIILQHFIVVLYRSFIWVQVTLLGESSHMPKSTLCQGVL